MPQRQNQITLIGSLTKDAELRYTPDGLPILTMPLAGAAPINTNGQQPDRRITWYHHVTAFGSYAEDIIDHLTRGTIVFIQGRLNYRSWTTDTGQFRSNLQVLADRTHIVKQPNDPNSISIDQFTQPVLVNGSLNRVELIGNLTRDAEHKQTHQSAVTSMRIAVNERYTDRNGKQHSKAHFVDVDCWNNLSTATQHIKKGTPVRVTGRLELDSWTDKEGTKRYKLKVNADTFQEFHRPHATNPANKQAEATETTATPASSNPPN